MLLFSVLLVLISVYLIGPRVGMYLLEGSPEFSGLILLLDVILGYLSGEDYELILKFTPGEESARD
jgi:hypothetical protein